MTVYVSIGAGVILLRVRAEAAGTLGDLTFEVRPGESAFGKGYDEWIALGSGPHWIEKPG
jgi:hypothetical protein